jgi:hypothetical protein
MNLFAFRTKTPAGTFADNETRQVQPAQPDNSPMALAVADLLEKLKALAAAAKTGEPTELRQLAARRYGTVLGGMRASMEKISVALRSLAVQSAHGAAHVDPNVLSRILDRMDSMGDATLRQIEGRIGVTASREDRKHLQNLRDETRKWLDARDAHLQDAQIAADELGERAKVLREALMARAGRLMKAAEMTAPIARISASSGLRHASPEAAGFAASLHALTSAARLPLAD